MIDCLGGVLLSDIGEMRIDGCGRGAAMAKNPLNVSEA